MGPKGGIRFLERQGYLSGSAADEEPLVDGGIDGRRGELLVLGQGRQLVGRDAAGRVADRQVGAVRCQ